MDAPSDSSPCGRCGTGESMRKLVDDNTKEGAGNLIMFNWGEHHGWHTSRFVGYARPTKAAAKTKAKAGVMTLWVAGRVQIISLEEGAIVHRCRLVCAFAKSVWVREAYPQQGVMVTARRPD
jgi:hypothetical protein